MSTSTPTSSPSPSTTTFDFGDGNGPVPAHQHKNPDGSVGGWVADTAFVSNNVHVGKEARIYEYAKLTAEAEVYGDAQISGNVIIRLGAQVRGTVVAKGGCLIEGWGVRIDGSGSGSTVLLHSQVTVRGNAKIQGNVSLINCHVTDRASVLNPMSSFLTLADTHISGMATIQGPGRVTGCEISDGVFVNGDGFSLNETSLTNDVRIEGAVFCDRAQLSGKCNVKDTAYISNSGLSGHCVVTGGPRVVESALQNVDLHNTVKVELSEITGVDHSRARNELRGNTTVTRSHLSGRIGMVGSPIVNRCRISGSCYLSGSQNLNRIEVTSDFYLDFFRDEAAGHTVDDILTGTLRVKTKDSTKKLRYWVASVTQESVSPYLYFSPVAETPKKYGDEDTQFLEPLPVTLERTEEGPLISFYCLTHEAVDEVKEAIYKKGEKGDTHLSLKKGGTHVSLKDFQKTLPDYKTEVQALIIMLSASLRG